MNTRRIPFQFSTTDPLARQRELEKRFGLQPTCPKMYVDVNNPLSMGTTKETSSPRFQHRVPIFAEGYDQPIHSSSVDSMASFPDNKKPNVRVIPIEIEGADNRSQRHRTFSGPADSVTDRCDSLALNKNEEYPFNRFNFEGLSRSAKPKYNEKPRIYNIPIQVDGVNNLSKCSKVDVAQKPKNIASTVNECSNKVKSLKKDEDIQPEPNKNEIDPHKINVEIFLKKIEDILTEFKTYEIEVVEFNGTSKDKQYRYLDEMLTRCMLQLDDIDTMGNEKIRLARKNAVKKIQASIDLLESKANIKPEAQVSQIQSIPNKDSPMEMKDNVVEIQDNLVKDDNSVVNNSEMIEMDLTASDKIHSEISNGISSDANEVESSEVASLLQNTTNSAEMEIPAEITNSGELQKLDVSFEDQTKDLSKAANKAENENYSEESSSLQQQQICVPETEMSGEIALISTNSTQPPEALRCDDCDIEKNKDFRKLTEDVEMNENATSNVVEVTEKSLSLNETVNMPNDMPDVEMEEICDIPISPKETDEKIESETAEKVITHSSENINQNSVDLNVEAINPKDAEMKDIDVTESTSSNKLVCDLSEQDAKSVAGLEKHETVNTEIKNL